jgi:tRNA A-37 threonylcarbamoyl transferase component Bud32
LGEKANAGLAAIHSLGIAHGDVRCNNIIVMDADGQEVIFLDLSHAVLDADEADFEDDRRRLANVFSFSDAV